MPVPHSDHVQIGADVIFCVEKLCEFPDGQRVTHRQRKVRDQIRLVRIEHRPFDNLSSQEVRSVQYEKGDFPFRGFLHAIRHAHRVGVKPHTRVLNIENQRVDALEHFVGGTSRVPIKAVDGKASRRIFGG